MYTHKSILIERNFIIQYRLNGPIIKLENKFSKFLFYTSFTQIKTAGEEIILAEEQSTV